MSATTTPLTPKGRREEQSDHRTGRRSEPVCEWDGAPLGAAPHNLHLTIEARRQRRFRSRQSAPLGLGRLQSEVIVGADPLLAFQQELALDERLRFKDVAFEDAEGRMPFDVGYTGPFERPDQAGRMYWMADYTEPIPDTQWATVIDLDQQRRRRRGSEVAEKVANVIQFPIAGAEPTSMSLGVGIAALLLRYIA